MIDLNNSKRIDLKVLQEELNLLQFDLLDSFDKALAYTEGFGYENETILYFRGKFNYAIKLIPVKDSYSYVYR